MNFVTYLLISNNWKDDSYNLILIIINNLTKIVNYKPVKTTIDIASLRKIIINVVMRHNNLSNSIVSYKNVLFMFEF